MNKLLTNSFICDNIVTVIKRLHKTAPPAADKQAGNGNTQTLKGPVKNMVNDTEYLASFAKGR